MDQFNQELEQQRRNNNTDIRSTIVEPGDEEDRNLDDSDGQTVHSNRENQICEIPISEDPLNFGKNQISFTLVKSNPVPPIITKLFDGKKLRLSVQISEQNFEN
jgi:hypothetical protein